MDSVFELLGVRPQVVNLFQNSLPKISRSAPSTGFITNPTETIRVRWQAGQLGFAFGREGGTFYTAGQCNSGGEGGGVKAVEFKKAPQ